MARKPDDVETRALDWGTIKWLVSPELDRGAGLTMGEVIIYPGQGHAQHKHPGEEEILYVISGKGRQTVDDDTFDIQEGDAVHIPADTFHSTFNTTWSPLRLVVVYNPGGAEAAIDSQPGVRVLPAGEAPRWTQSR